MKSIATDIKDLLLTSELKLEFGKDLFIGKEPEKQIPTVTLYDTSSQPPVLAINSKENIEQGNFMVRVKHTDYEKGYKLIQDIGYFL